MVECLFSKQKIRVRFPILAFLCVRGFPGRVDMGTSSGAAVELA